LAHTPDGLVIWDVRPTPDFRHSIPTGSNSVADAIVALAKRRLSSGSVSDLISRASVSALVGSAALGGDIVLSA